MANDNTELGRFDLVGIPPAPRGVPQIEVTFDIDRDGIVHVHAKDLGTGKEQSIRITAPKKLSKEEIDKMVKDSEKFAEEDKKKKEEVELKNTADTLVYSVEKSLKDYGDKISKDEKENIEKKAGELKEALKKDNSDDIKKKMDELQKASYKLAEEVYKDAQAKAQKNEGRGTKDEGREAKDEGRRMKDEGRREKDEDILDADYKVEDEDKEKDK